MEKSAARRKLEADTGGTDARSDDDAEADAPDPTAETPAEARETGEQSAARQRLAADDGDDAGDDDVDGADGDASQCIALTAAGSRCKNDAAEGSQFCAHPEHAPGKTKTVDAAAQDDGADAGSDDVDGDDRDDVDDASDDADQEDSDDVDDDDRDGVDDASDDVDESRKRAMTAGPTQSGSSARTDGGEPNEF